MIFIYNSIYTQKTYHNPNRLFSHAFSCLKFNTYRHLLKTAEKPRFASSCKSFHLSYESFCTGLLKTKTLIILYHSRHGKHKAVQTI